MNHPFVHPDSPLILASASPRRKRLLQQAGLPFQVAPADIQEDYGGEDPEQTVCALAVQKAEAVKQGFPEQWILGADTVVLQGGVILGKPADRDQARSMLERLSSREHRVVTGFSIHAPSGGAVHREAVTTMVRFRALNQGEIERYIATGEPFGKAGAYAIQGMGDCMVESISGSYTNVVGLPLCTVIQALLAVGALARFPVPARASLYT